jgi:predicted nucleic acid-binding protein
MSAADFLDSNVLVYLFDNKDARRRDIAQQLVLGAHDKGTALISFQVVQETLHVLTRKLRPPMRVADAQDVLRDLLAPLWQVHPSPALYAKALALQDSLGFSFYDSLIVAAALQAGCKRLLTEDLQHGQRIEGLRVENPFREAM